MSGNKFKVGDRVRSVIEYRRDMEGTVEAVDNDGVWVAIESLNVRTGKRVDVSCRFRRREIVLVAARHPTESKKGGG